LILITAEESVAGENFCAEFSMGKPPTDQNFPWKDFFVGSPQGAQSPAILPVDLLMRLQVP
jgi:hypothetical protein